MKAVEVRPIGRIGRIGLIGPMDDRYDARLARRTNGPLQQWPAAPMTRRPAVNCQLLTVN